MGQPRTDLPEKPSDAYNAQGLYRNIPVPEGFILPERGDAVTCHRRFETPVSGVFIPAGAIGRVGGVLQDNIGYNGVVVCFAEIARRPGPYGKPLYSSGLVVPFDYAADERIFTYTRAKPAALA